MTDKPNKLRIERSESGNYRLFLPNGDEEILTPEELQMIVPLVEETPEPTDEMMEALARYLLSLDDDE